MLIIFDLDDTLIETSKCLTPLYLKFAYEAMVKLGLSGEFQELIEMDAKAVSSRSAIKEFWAKVSDEKEILNRGLEVLKTPIPEGVEVELVPGASEILNTLGAQHSLALVTAGDEILQLQKMKKAGIQPEQFSKLVVCFEQNKKSAYQVVLEELRLDPSDAIVCGDRVSRDLIPAKELGIYTVHFQNGRGLIDRDAKEGVDLRIKTLRELREVFIKHES